MCPFERRTMLAVESRGERSRNSMEDARSDTYGDLRRYEALLDMADVMVQHSNLQELLQATALRLQEVTIFQFLNFSVYEAARNVMVLHTWQDSGGSPLAMEELPIEEAVSGWVLAHQEVLWLADLNEEKRFPRVLDPLRQAGFRS